MPSQRLVFKDYAFWPQNQHRIQVEEAFLVVDNHLWPNLS